MTVTIYRYCHLSTAPLDRLSENRGNPYRCRALSWHLTPAPLEKPVRRLAACVLSAVVFVLLGAPSSQAAAPLRYVALGDSYSAASGVLPPDPTAPPSCLRSTSNYPHVIAGATGAQLTDVTCGGAETGDFFAPQYTGVAPQLDAVDADAQLVTMTIGGNDSG